MKTKWLLVLLFAGSMLLATAQTVVTPQMTFIVRTNFPTPVYNEQGIYLHITNQTRLVVWWYAIHEGVGWDFLYRTNGTWWKPVATYNTRELLTGKLQKSLLLDYFDDYDERYQFLPIVTVNPRAQ